MKNKIKEYVNYVFRFEKSDDVNEMKEEILSNLYDRYDEFLLKFNDEQKAYVETIKTLGDFDIKEEIAEEFNDKPQWTDITLIISVISSIIGAISIIFNFFIGIIIFTISISLYLISANYLFKLSQYVKKNEKDIIKHNMLLQIIFKYMKTCFVFWSISISIVIVRIIEAIVNLFISIGLISQFNMSNPLKVARIILVINIFIFIISIIISYYLLTKLYNKLVSKYYLLTGEKSLQSHVSTFKDFLKSDLKANLKFDINSLENGSIKIIDFNKIKLILKQFVMSVYFMLLINLVSFIFSNAVFLKEVKVTKLEHGQMTSYYYTSITDLYLIDLFGTITFCLTIIWAISNIMMLFKRKSRLYRTLTNILNTLMLISTFVTLYIHSITNAMNFDDKFILIILISVSLIMNAFNHYICFIRNKKLKLSEK